MNIKFCKMNKYAVIPTKRDEDAAFDLYTTEHEKCDGASDNIDLLPGETIKFHTGLKAVIPDDVWVLLKERSSTGPCGLSLRSGVIDSGYRGEWIIMMTNCGNKPIRFTDQNSKPTYSQINDCWVLGTKKAIAQFVVIPKNSVSSEEIDEETFAAAPETLRGNGGWGSSGK